MLYIRVPASTSNLGAGFDTFGLALSLYNEFTVEVAECYTVTMEGEGKNLPRDERNLFIRVYKRACQVFGYKEMPFKLHQKNSIPTARGLGSSSTAIVGGLLAFEGIHGKKLSLEEKLAVAFEFEPHPDNLLPALVGGFVVCAVDEKVYFVKLDFPQEVHVALAVPDFELSTEEARAVLKREVDLKDAIFNIQRASLFIASVATRNLHLLKEATKDKLHQPYRSKLIPGFEDVIQTAYEFGAYAAFLSGAGPSIASLCHKDRAKEVAEGMCKAFSKHSVTAKPLVLAVEPYGSTLTSMTLE